MKQVYSHPEMDIQHLLINDMISVSGVAGFNPDITGEDEIGYNW